MSLSAEVLKKMREFGLTLDQVIELAETLTAAPIRSTGAERQRRYRERQASQNNVTRYASPDDEEAVSLSPTPPNPSQESPTPYPPLKGVLSPTPSGKPPKGAFERWWSAYPKKVGKLKAERAYDAAWRKIGDPDPERVLLEAARRMAASTEAEFYPNPLTWLGQGRWLDEPAGSNGYAPSGRINGATGPPVVKDEAYWAAIRARVVADPQTDSSH